MIFPANLRALNICRTRDGYQASLQTDDHASNAFTVAIAASVEEAVREVLECRSGPIPPPPY